MLVFCVILSWLWVMGLVLAFLAAWRRGRAYDDLVLPPAALEGAAPPTVAVIIPARNESANIGGCLQGLLQQTATPISIIIVNDNSTDDTAHIVEAVAAANPQVKLVNGQPLPPGWLGKPYACWQGALTIPREAQWLCFMDADTVAKPALLATARAYAEQKQLDMFSLHPYQNLDTFWERLIIPIGFLLVGLLHDLRRVNQAEAPDAAANGQFILIRRAAYFGVGGHADTPHDKVLEDMALARRVKQAGYRMGIGLGPDLIRTRMYHGLKPMWEGVSKLSVELVSNGPRAVGVAGLLLALGWLPLVWVVWATAQAVIEPTGLAFSGLGAALLNIVGVMALFLVFYKRTGRFFQAPTWVGLFFTLALSLSGLMMLDGVRRHWTKRIRWKGRVYQPS